MYGLQAPPSPKLTSPHRHQSNEIYAKSKLRCRYHADAYVSYTVSPCDCIDPVSFGYR